MLSFDARVMLRPSRAFRDRSVAAGASLWTATRRPLFLTLVLATSVSILASGGVTARIVGPAAIYWILVPLIELTALAAIVGSRWRRLPVFAVVDAFFAGHGPWVILLIVLGLTIPALGPAEVFPALIRLAVIAVPLVLAWSAWIDVCFFRDTIGESRGRAVADALLTRLLTWPIVFGLFAVPGMTPVSITREIAEALAEILR